MNNFCRLVIGTYDGRVCVWNVETGECTGTLHGHTAAVNCVAFDSNTIVSGSEDTTVRVLWVEIINHFWPSELYRK